MIIIWGKLAGLALGAFGGFVGAAFGLLVGHLLDVVAGEFVLRRAVGQFLTGPGRVPRQFQGAVATAALCIAAVIEADWQPSDDDTEAFRLGVRKWGRVPDPPAQPMGTILRHLHRATRQIRQLWARLRLRLRGGQTGGYLDAALRLRPAINLELLAARVSAEIDAKDRAKMIEICRATLDTRIGGAVLERLVRLARLIELPDEWIRVALPPEDGTHRYNRIDLAACALLEVSPDANLDEVKRAYRRLAAHFHPDTAEVLSPEQRDASSVAFVRIREAYDRVVGQMGQG